MPGPPILHGYHYSVYTRVVRMTLAEKGVEYDYREVNPFDPNLDAAYLRLHPFRRVPVLEHGDFRCYETAAITQLVDESCDGPSLQPAAAQARARMRQIIAVVDAYGYWPMVRQVYTQRVLMPRLGEAADEQMIADGLRRSERVLDALDEFAGEAGILDGRSISLADLHLAPMIGYFQQAPEGNEALEARSGLNRWWQRLRQRDSYVGSDPGLPGKDR